MNWLLAVEESAPGWSSWTIGGCVFLGLIAALAVFNIKDIWRYIRISTM